jgi:hypothetical protein
LKQSVESGDGGKLERAQALLRQADQCERRGEHLKAAQCWRQAFKLSPDLESSFNDKASWGDEQKTEPPELEGRSKAVVLDSPPFNTAIESKGLTWLGLLLIPF